MTAVLPTPVRRDARHGHPGSTAELLTRTAVLETYPPAERSPALVYLASLGNGSRRAMQGALEAIAGLLGDGQHDAASLPWHLLRHEHTAAVRAILSERHAPATARRMLAALKGTLRAAWRLDLMDAETYRRAIDVEPARGSRLPRGRALDAGELTALFRVCATDPTPAGARDAALLAVLYGAGLRRSEAVALDFGDVDVKSSAVTVRRGKGSKDRVTYLPAGGIAAVRAWLEVRGKVEGPLFVGVNKGGRVAWRRLTDAAVRVVVLKRARQAGVAAFSPHDLRRTFVSHLLDAGADVSAVQGLAGHASVSTTAQYDRRGERAKQKASGLLHVPFTASSRSK